MPLRTARRTAISPAAVASTTPVYQPPSAHKSAAAVPTAAAVQSAAAASAVATAEAAAAWAPQADLRSEAATTDLRREKLRANLGLFVAP